MKYFLYNCKYFFSSRCGVKDRVQEQEFGSSGVKAEYVLQGSRWHLKHLTYR